MDLRILRELSGDVFGPMPSPYGRQYTPARSVIVRGKIARRLVRLASRIDRRPDVKYVIEHHHPKAWRYS